MFKRTNCTLYILGAFGFMRVEVRSVEVTRPTDATLRVEFVEKGKRKSRLLLVPVAKSKNVVMVEGFGHPKELVPTFEPSAIEGGQITRHSSFSPKWAEEFHPAFEAYVAEKGLTCFDYADDLAAIAAE